MNDNRNKSHWLITGKGGGGAEQVQADWNQSDDTQPDYIKNKPTIPDVQVQSDWNESDNTQPDYIKNKPTVLTQWFGTQAEYDLIDPKDPNTIYNIEGSDNVQADWNQNDSSADDYIKNKPTIPAAQVNSDWNETDSSSKAYIANKPTIPVVPAMATETLTFTLQGGTVRTIDFYVVPNYFYVEDISGSDNTLSITKNSASAPDVEVFCSTDKVNWSSMGTTSTTEITATVPANGKLYLKANANAWGTDSYNNIKASGNHNIGGNIMSLLYGDDFKGKSTFASGSTYIFYSLFYYNTTLVNASNLELPATTLADSCYREMFNGCTNLTTAPALPATTLYNNCYKEMFQNCTSLTTAPELPATSTPYSCYGGMFRGCTALTTAPALPATNLDIVCYSEMFQNCTSLTTAPTLPATRVSEYGYRGMFSGCTNLNTITTYANDISADQCISGWLSNVAPQGDFYNLGSATYTSGDGGIPSGWTEHTSL